MEGRKEEREGGDPLPSRSSDPGYGPLTVEATSFE